MQQKYEKKNWIYFSAPHALLWTDAILCIETSLEMIVKSKADDCNKLLKYNRRFIYYALISLKNENWDTLSGAMVLESDADN